MGEELDRAADLIVDLYRAGEISQASLDALLLVGKTRVVQQLEAGLGARASNREVLLTTVLVDDSPSVGPHVASIRLGHRTMLEALGPETSGSDVLVFTRLFNRGALAPYRDIDAAIRLTEANFSANQLLSWTPLYIQSILTLCTVVAKAREIENAGGRVRTFTLILTDGQNNPSSGEMIKAAHVRTLVTDMLDFSTNHIVAGMGVGEVVDFRQVFRSMGIPDPWIFTAGATADEIRQQFRRITAALHLAASGEDGFSQLALGPPS